MVQGEIFRIKAEDETEATSLAVHISALHASGTPVEIYWHDQLVKVLSIVRVMHTRA